MNQQAIQNSKKVNFEPFRLSKYIEQHGTIITLFIATVGLLGPIGYLTGTIYHLVYLSEFGINSGSFSLSVQESYLYAYLVGTHYINSFSNIISSKSGLTYFLCFIAGSVLFTYLVAKIARYWIETKEHPTKTSSKLNNFFQFFHYENNDFSKAIIVVYETVHWLGSTTLTVLFFILIWSSILLSSYEQAQSTAQKGITTYLESGCHYPEDKELYNCSQILDQTGKIIIEGMLVISSKDKLAVFTKKGTFIHTLQPNETLFRPRQHQVIKN
ncbi:hypothetical protein [Aliamphritea hakodatensis]|uniref:hypothetical protein n=1 Tax=Aliamphritea hakodatensis TaxID=2895352 RepID=UPI0022FD6AF4|nr:hypothetical protein [Aliamphritea hakodatensis]